MAIKKSELYSSLWKSCDELRGGMDASQYKDYVLVLLFVKYVSDKYSGQKDAMVEIPKGGSFADMVALKGDKKSAEKSPKYCLKKPILYTLSKFSCLLLGQECLYLKERPREKSGSRNARGSFSSRKHQLLQFWGA